MFLYDFWMTLRYPRDTFGRPNPRTIGDLNHAYRIMVRVHEKPTGCDGVSCFLMV